MAFSPIAFGRSDIGGGSSLGSQIWGGEFPPKIKKFAHLFYRPKINYGNILKKSIIPLFLEGGYSPLNHQQQEEIRRVCHFLNVYPYLHNF